MIFPVRICARWYDVIYDNVPRFAFQIVLLNTVVFFGLFANFYFFAYMKKKNKEQVSSSKAD